MREWKMVPVEPTPEMLRASNDSIRWFEREVTSRACYAAMLAAAPTPPAEPPEDVAGLVERLRRWASYDTDSMIDAMLTEAADALARLAAERDALREALRVAEAALADIGDADREPGDDVAWCEARAAKALPIARAALARAKDNNV